MVAMMFWYGGHWAFWEAGLMWVGMIVFWGLLIWGIFALISSASRGPRDSDRGADARSILDARLARGEIDADEYRRLRDLISSDSPRSPAGSGRRPS
jgi:putative membrane protein